MNPFIGGIPVGVRINKPNWTGLFLLPSPYLIIIITWSPLYYHFPAIMGQFSRQNDDPPPIIVYLRRTSWSSFGGIDQAGDPVEHTHLLGAEKDGGLFCSFRRPAKPAINTSSIPARWQDMINRLYVMRSDIISRFDLPLYIQITDGQTDSQLDLWIIVVPNKALDLRPEKNGASLIIEKANIFLCFEDIKIAPNNYLFSRASSAIGLAGMALVRTVFSEKWGPMNSANRKIYSTKIWIRWSGRRLSKRRINKKGATIWRGRRKKRWRRRRRLEWQIWIPRKRENVS